MHSLLSFHLHYLTL